MSKEGESLSNYLKKILERAPGIQAAAITDRDGALVVKADDLSEEDIGSHFASTFAVATDQAGKLKMGKALSVISFYDNRVIYHLSHSPLILSFIGTADANVGVLVSFSEDIKRALDPLRDALQEKE
ncbi:ragulator complex protein LAMTOR3 [Planoprotostelium fungivorum]|uniref:Ragulator complex protein LAMTOR3 n=1 Tax=Planoprotostelium fungivorum TaxID=1890364 RepID=A0A2P6NZX3_9EUKA|nr:ragulator complex protein LAMTOR3 [Planoprotostelium fungivorum]